MTADPARRFDGPLSYEQARDIAGEADPAARRALAERTDAPTEVLYFLAEDSVPDIRRTVAANPSTPAKGNLLLSVDVDPQVRQALAEKLQRLGRWWQSEGATARNRSAMEAVLAGLAADELVAIRAIVAQLVKDAADADRGTVRRLAWDDEILVAAPILQYSPLLTDDDLLERIAGSTVEGVRAAIARRVSLGPRVTVAIVDSDDVPAITHLLKNANASLQEGTLDALIDGAARQPSWQEPLVYRPELREQSMQRLVQSVAAHVLDHILDRQDLPVETACAVVKEIEDRLRQRPEAADASARPAREADYEARLERARGLAAAGQLTETTLMVALLTDHTEDLVAALAVLATVPVAVVLDIIAAQSARAMCALAWAAGQSAGFAVELQARLAGVSAAALLHPTAEGGYPLEDGEMAWQLEMFGAGAPA